MSLLRYGKWQERTHLSCLLGHCTKKGFLEEVTLCGFWRKPACYRQAFQGTLGADFPKLLGHFSQRGGALPHQKSQPVSPGQALPIWVRRALGGCTQASSWAVLDCHQE